MGTDETVNVPRPSDLLRVWQEPAGESVHVVVHVAGEVDLTTAPQVDDLLCGIEPRQAEPRCVILVLTGVTFLSSAGLSLLIKNDRRMRDAGGHLYVVTGNRLVNRTITRTGLAETLVLFDTLGDAVTAAP
ncbi:STAS domain-containing protein [Actinophytocola algeriensis]|uniref:Anti-sigma factor antagonist n=1 Tax=Actinophytocola algeriensis TaxID=1768010 RepID=A0A7W7VGH5_9PSEU|nr:STAS domain-containing protein [Actinophytocola algeriensis]MBB4909179.1 anti-anti-sigma factor [Actinophytocola algeriensis]MBE1474433.1 anti-anti-sigma factor [Actinophytocola algeriensis]